MIVPAACVAAGDTVDQLGTIRAVHNSTPRPGLITWDHDGGPTTISAVQNVTVTNTTTKEHDR
ncbi:hypothetical protein KMZ30_07360 [Phycicoccus sp. KQZ13P-1]|uniref:hypothetical protein n=1 Tax=Phycicoccus mangrovi TaxID=2840470 RepID=UPI001C0083FF|nr:hypothetical protein [Phycicoccus mangrovi]MBT9255389.1 hypothetical protein [Phycicoccus mangrovi]